MKEEVKKYKLYAGKVQNVPENVKYSLVPSHCQYLLIYTDQEPLEKSKFVEIDETNVKLNTQEREWLFQSKLYINAQHLKEREREYVDAFNNFFDVLEQELQKEKRIEAKK